MCLAAELPFGSDLLGHASHFRRECAQLVHHRVDGVFQLRGLALGFDGDLLRQVAARDGGRYRGDVSHLSGEVPSQRVHVISQILPGSGHPGHVSLAAQFAIRAHLARHSGDFGGEGAELIDHRVDGILQLEDLTFRLGGDLSVQVALRDGRRNVGDVSHLAGKVRRHEVHVVRQVLPRSRHAGHFCLPAKSSFGTYFLGHARHFGSKCAELIDHDVDRLLQLEDLTLCFRCDLSRQFALGDRGSNVGNVSDLAGETRGHRVHVVGEVFPGSADAWNVGLAAEFSFGAYFLGDTSDF